MHSPTWTGCSIIHGSGPPARAGLDARVVRPGHVERLDRTDVHADAAVDAAARGRCRCGSPWLPPLWPSPRQRDVARGPRTDACGQDGRPSERVGDRRGPSCRPGPRPGRGSGRAVSPGPGRDPRGRRARRAPSGCSAWSFSRMLRRWNLTVFSVIPSSAAISLLRRPAVTSAKHLELALGQRDPARPAGARSRRRPRALADARTPR